MGSQSYKSTLLKTEHLIPVAEPVLSENVERYVLDCIRTGWISSAGQYVGRFEQALADFFGVKQAIACCNGTAALHLALAALGVGPGDEVIVPTVTFVASANAVRYTGAVPVLVDCDPDSWLIDLGAAEAAITPRTRAIMPVDLYGHPAPMDEINAFAQKHNLLVVQDSAESLGALYKGKPVGGLADVTTLSFFGNKTLTTGEGGALLTNDEQLAKTIRLLRGQGQDPQRRYWFIEMGYNYRMTNIEAAIGLAQLEEVPHYLQHRRQVAQWYKLGMRESLPDWTAQVEQPWAQSTHWLNTFLMPKESPLSREQIMTHLHDAWNVETRPIFYPLHILPIYQDTASQSCPVADDVALRGISFPTSSKISQQSVQYVIEALVETMRSATN